LDEQSLEQQKDLAADYYLVAPEQPFHVSKVELGEDAGEF